MNKIEFDYIDITDSMRNLKSFLKLRDNHEAFDIVRNRSGVGIPALVVDGEIILNITEAIAETLKV